MAQLQQDLQNELITTNQLLHLIGNELQQIKQFTKSGGVFETNIKKNVSLMSVLANLQHINLEKIPQITKNQGRSYDNVEIINNQRNDSEDNN